MILPLAKLGTLALRTFSKPIANRLKKEAGVHPKFRQFIVNFAQVLTLSQHSSVFLLLSVSNFDSETVLNFLGLIDDFVEWQN
ncbi:hypothetical protein KSP40_PGU008173 [Platanthera guangdongensis]|uniref:Uncharacterized protein n=1 Tax=Platanthera guangdongensis TaxID=2320717 RepID=A0ABR2MWW6_9ASPA